MLDADLAELYGVPTKALVQAVKRNPARFPPDFLPGVIRVAMTGTPAASDSTTASPKLSSPSTGPSSASFSSAHLSRR